MGSDISLQHQKVLARSLQPLRRDLNKNITVVYKGREFSRISDIADKLDSPTSLPAAEVRNYAQVIKILREIPESEVDLAFLDRVDLQTFLIYKEVLSSNARLVKEFEGRHFDEAAGRALLRDHTIMRSDKLYAHSDRIQEWQAGGNPFPVTVDLDLTTECNQHCPHCTFAFMQGKKYQLSVDFLKDIIAQLGINGAKVRGLVLTGGGEPLLHPHLVYLVRWAGQNGLRVGIVTNGQELLPKLCTQLLTCDNLSWIRIGLDAGAPEGYQKMHKKSGRIFFQIIDNLRRAVDTQTTKRSDTTIGLGFLVSKDNRSEMLQATLLAKSLGLSYIQFKPLELTDPTSNCSISYQEVEAIKDILRCQTQEMGRLFSVMASRSFYQTPGEISGARDYPLCHGQQFSTVIGADGKMYICTHKKYHPDFELGDLTKESFASIWQGQRRKELVHCTIDTTKCLPNCRLDEANDALENIRITGRKKHREFI